MLRPRAGADTAEPRVGSGTPGFRVQVLQVLQVLRVVGGLSRGSAFFRTFARASVNRREPVRIWREYAVHVRYVRYIKVIPQMRFSYCEYGEANMVGFVGMRTAEHACDSVPNMRVVPPLWSFSDLAGRPEAQARHACSARRHWAHCRLRVGARPPQAASQPAASASARRGRSLTGQ
jgi:hypothetical protein